MTDLTDPINNTNPEYEKMLKVAYGIIGYVGEAKKTVEEIREGYGPEGDTEYPLVGLVAWQREDLGYTAHFLFEDVDGSRTDLEITEEDFISRGKGHSEEFLSSIFVYFCAQVMGYEDK